MARSNTAQALDLPFYRRPDSGTAAANGSSHLDIIRSALDRASAPFITCSFQASGVVLLHMLRQFKPDIPVLFLDTFHHFPATYSYRDEMTRRWNLNLVNVKAADPAPGLWERDHEACCARHKVDPLFAALDGYDVWFTGLRRSQSATRTNLPTSQPFQLPSGALLEKVSPLADWTTRDIWAYAKAHEIPLLPLYDEGYTSIGCEPCTMLPSDPSDERSGRWGGQKLECGIHLQQVMVEKG